MIGEVTFTCRHGLPLFTTNPTTEVRLPINEDNYVEVLGLIERAIRLEVEKARSIAERSGRAT